MLVASTRVGAELVARYLVVNSLDRAFGLLLSLLRLIGVGCCETGREGSHAGSGMLTNCPPTGSVARERRRRARGTARGLQSQFASHAHLFACRSRLFPKDLAMSHTPIAVDGFLNAPQLAARLGVSVATIRRWAQCGEGPPSTKMSKRRVAWSIVLLEEWLAARTSQVRTQASTQ